jgi:hypothetical protein
LQEWQQANRLGEDPRRIKVTLKECWSTSDNKQAFESALVQKGYYLASGDRRGYVAVDWRGEVYSLSRWLGEKNKALAARLGDPSQLPSVDATKAKIDAALVQRFREHEATLKAMHAQEEKALTELRRMMVAKQRSQREALRKDQETRWAADTKLRSARMRQGWRGVWDKVTGQSNRTRARNELEALQAQQRDRLHRDQLVWSHIHERAKIDQQRTVQQAQLTQHVQQLIALLPEHTHRVFALQQKPMGP